DEYPDRLLGRPLGCAATNSGLAGAYPGLSDCTNWTWPSVGFTHTRCATEPPGRWPSGSLGRWATGPLPRPAENRPAEPRRRTRLFALARFFDRPATHSRPLPLRRYGSRWPSPGPPRPPWPAPAPGAPRSWSAT